MQKIATITLSATCPEGKDEPELRRSRSLEKRIVGCLNKVRNFGDAFCSCTIRTVWACFGRGRMIDAFSARTTKTSEIKSVTARQKTKARPLNPRKISADSPS